MLNVCVAGTGYVGLATGACLAELGHAVTCADLDPRKVEHLRAGLVSIYEPGLAELVGSGRLSFTTEWPVFRDLDWRVLTASGGSPVVVDLRNCLDRDALAGMGLRDVDLGRPEAGRAAVPVADLVRWDGPEPNLDHAAP